VRLGAVVEIIHTATLVHDDIIDEAKTRRGRPAANTQWGNSKCVLAGDWLYMQAFKMAVQERNFRILDTLIELTQQMVEGELLQMEKLGKLITLDEYFDLIYRKTACLFSVCMRLGAILGGATAACRKRLWASTGTISAWPFRSLTTCSIDRVGRCSGQAGGKRSARGQGYHGGDPRAGALHPEERAKIEKILRDRAFNGVTHGANHGDSAALRFARSCDRSRRAVCGVGAEGDLHLSGFRDQAGAAVGAGVCGGARKVGSLLSPRFSFFTEFPEPRSARIVLTIGAFANIETFPVSPHPKDFL
jgi:hypothetical protein